MNNIIIIIEWTIIVIVVIGVTIWITLKFIHNKLTREIEKIDILQKIINEMGEQEALKTIVENIGIDKSIKILKSK